ncbi:MAG: methylmalonyl-CoA mutase, partial [Ignavibacteria bacterium]
ELAFTFANAIAYVRAALEAGLDIDTFSSQLSFFFNSHNNMFEEIAKFRAARRLWARIMKERFKAKRPESMKLRFHAQTGGSTLTAQQIENNVVRVSIQALAAVLGGCQSLHTNSKDEALSLPSEEAARIALRTQQIIANETGVADTVDPLGGSYYVEQLTDAIESGAQAYLEAIESMGGAVQAIEKQFYQNEIAKSAYQYQRAIEEKQKIIVGVNDFIATDESPPAVLRIDEHIQQRQVEGLQDLKRRRDASKVAAALSALATAARGKENVIPHVLNAVEAYATLGEISDQIRKIWGEYA